MHIAHTRQYNVRMQFIFWAVGQTEEERRNQNECYLSGNGWIMQQTFWNEICWWIWSCVRVQVEMER